MKLSRSTYYAYASRRTYRESAWKATCAARVKECFEFHRRRYGTRRIAAELKIGRSTARRVMRRENLRAIQPKSFKPKTTDSQHGLAVSLNLLENAECAPAGKGEVFVGDITYLRLRDGRFCYLACLQDKFTRRIVGWKVSERMTAQLVIDVFLQARRFDWQAGDYSHRPGQPIRLRRISPAALHGRLSAIDEQARQLL